MKTTPLALASAGRTHGCANEGGVRIALLSPMVAPRLSCGGPRLFPRPSSLSRRSYGTRLLHSREQLYRHRLPLRLDTATHHERHPTTPRRCSSTGSIQHPTSNVQRPTRSTRVSTKADTRHGISGVLGSKRHRSKQSHSKRVQGPRFVTSPRAPAQTRQREGRTGVPHAYKREQTGVLTSRIREEGTRVCM